MKQIEVTKLTCRFSHSFFSTTAIMSRMLLQIFIFLCILVECLSLPQKSEVCLSNDLPVRCEFVSTNVCLEFVSEPKTWPQARCTCEKKGGKLLKVLNSSVKFFLSNITTERDTRNCTWWMGERVRADHLESKESIQSEWNMQLCCFLFYCSLC